MADWHPIRVASRRTGLSPHVIRAWEKRYGAIVPKRTETGRRLYSQEDVERLGLLRRGTLAGRSIGQIAHLPTDELQRLVEEDEAAQRAVGGQTGEGRARRSRATGPALDACVEAIEILDAARLERALEQASASLSRPSLIAGVVVPLLQAIGDRWRDGSLRVSHEHLASAVVRTFVASLNGAFQTPADGPEIVITTPSGQMHEIGALLAAATAASEGWNITYLGPSLPADDIAGAVRERRARALALSLIYPSDAPHLPAELERLARQLPKGTALLVGGRAARAYESTLEAIGARIVPDYESLRRELESLREGGEA